MDNYDVIIRKGRVVLKETVVTADVAIKNGLIEKVHSSIAGTADSEVDAQGLYVFPGGIDVHAHFSEPGREHWEGFETGSAMMAAGGMTTYFDMPLNGIPSTVTVEALKEKAETGSRKSIADFGLWGGLVPGNEEELETLAAEGVVGFKAFMSPTGNKEFERSDDHTLFNGMQKIAPTGKLLALHSESAVIVKGMEQRYSEHTDAVSFSRSRPEEAEVEAVNRAISYAKVTKCPLHFVHISTAEAVERIQEARLAGVDVTLETCPHYLLFTEDTLVEKGAAAKCAPPLRSNEQKQKLIEALLDGKIDMVSSDHSPCPSDMKDTDDMFAAWGGISGGQYTFLAVLELAAAHGIKFPRTAQWLSGAPAERFGLSGSKGEIKEGKDADLVLVDMNKSFTVTKENMYMKNKHSVYEGMTFSASIEQTFLRGETIFSAAGKPVKRIGRWTQPQQ
ncbi:allantoinase [Sinobaca qinghaiensis]|uniref:Allantoinase n=1 Tax=Sinobaca qinghaiensis TaxID=342944 RepID=A0A419UZW6_9BACL|nr:allantoinase AllB [Sinobaca qinghaiensis]RKD71234.1 allantoinase [Sinobaca qinghaiensis]